MQGFTECANRSCTKNRQQSREKRHERKKLYQQKRQAQLDAWQADVDKLKANASEFSADTQLEINRHIHALKDKIDEGKAKLAEIAAASEESWESIRDGAETAWHSMRLAFSEALDKFRK